MRKLLEIIFAIILLLLIIIGACFQEIREIKKEREARIGEKVYLFEDTLIIKRYDWLSDKFTLSDNNSIKSKYLDELIHASKYKLNQKRKNK